MIWINGTESAVEFSKFNMYFLNDIKSENVKIVANTSDDSLELSYKAKDGSVEVVRYLVQSGSIYRDKVNICNKVKASKIEADEKNGTITVYLKIDDFEKTTTYVLEPKNNIDGSQVI